MNYSGHAKTASASCAGALAMACCRTRHAATSDGTCRLLSGGLCAGGGQRWCGGEDILREPLRCNRLICDGAAHCALVQRHQQPGTFLLPGHHMELR